MTFGLQQSCWWCWCCLLLLLFMQPCMSLQLSSPPPQPRHTKSGHSFGGLSVPQQQHRHATAAAAGGSVKHHEYIVIGAGPGGLQLAKFLQDAQRDYVVLEASSMPGGALRSLPRWRQLISINKRHTGRSHPEFTLRHDWNSLLTSRFKETAAAAPGSDRDPASAIERNLPPQQPPTTGRHIDAPSWRFGHYSSAYLPHADALVRYFEEFAANHSLAIRYGERVAQVYHDTTMAEADRVRSRDAAAFEVHTDSGAVFTCGCLVVATGLSKEVVPDIEGIELAQAYTEVPLNSADYTDERILILGRGNGAFEAATVMQESAAYVHIVGDTRGQVRLAWETHYPGDLRSAHNRLLDSYMLKSLDVVSEMELATTKLLRHGNVGQLPRATQRRMEGTIHGSGLFESNGTEELVWMLPRDDSALFNGIYRLPYHRVVRCFGWQWDPSTLGAVVNDGEAAPAFSSPRLPGMAPVAASLERTHSKFPSMSTAYESTAVPGLFFAGALQHAHDYRKASGGFIHGFRYLVRALHRYLEVQRHGLGTSPTAAPLVSTRLAHDGATAAPEAAAAEVEAEPGAQWPHTTLTSGREVLDYLLYRINTASGLYQMFNGHLTDVAVIEPRRPQRDDDSGGTDAGDDDEVSAGRVWHVYEEVPRGMVHSLAQHWSKHHFPDAEAPCFLTLSLEFGSNSSTPGRDAFRPGRTVHTLDRANDSEFLHPVLRLFDLGDPATRVAPQGSGDGGGVHVRTRPSIVHHIIEDALTLWLEPELHVQPLERFIMGSVVPIVQHGLAGMHRRLLRDMLTRAPAQLLLPAALLQASGRLGNRRGDKEFGLVRSKKVEDVSPGVSVAIVHVMRPWSDASLDLADAFLAAAAQYGADGTVTFIELQRTGAAGQEAHIDASDIDVLKHGRLMARYRGTAVDAMIAHIEEALR